MQSPEIIQWLQEQQLMLCETKLLGIPTLPVRSTSTDGATAPSTSTASVPDPVLTTNQADNLGEQSYQNAETYDLLDIDQDHDEGRAEGELQGHNHGQGLDLEQQNRTGIWSREASAFMSVSRIRNPDALWSIKEA